MKKPDKLIELIRAMNKSEKRYFAVFSGAFRKDNKTARLFRDLNNGNPVSDRPGGARSSEAVRRHKLYAGLLKSLNRYHADMSSGARGYEMLRSVEILYAKGLCRQAKQLLKKAMQEAEQSENLPVSMAVIRWEKKIMIVESFEEAGIPHTENLIAHEKKLLSAVENLNAYWECFFRIYMQIRRTGIFRRRDEIRKLDGIIRNSLKHSGASRSTFESGIIYCQVKSSYFFAANRFDRALTYGRKRVALMEERPDHIREDPHSYITALNNLLILYRQTKDYFMLKEVLSKMRAVPGQYGRGFGDNLQVKIFPSYNTELDMHIHTGDFEKGMALLPVIINNLSRFQGKISRVSEITFYYNLANIMFGTGKYREANEWILRILTGPQSSIREDILCFARILQLILYYETGDADLLEYAAVATYRYLRKRKRLYRIENIVLMFIRNKLRRIRDKNELLSAFRELCQEIKQISKNDFEKQALEYFDFLSWLESKISGIPFAEIVRKKTMHDA